MKPFVDHLKSRLSDDDYSLLSALVAALSEKANLEKLDAFPVWRAAVSLPLE
ncbi:MAG: hypothetical protein PHF56_24365 [Desulfuromonadaceae bacterium]|nr:hypothetical protein [Desulfuromonadaceae bacterium]